MIRSSVLSLLSVLVLSSWSTCSAVDVVLSDNLASTNTGSFSANPSRWQAQAFSTTLAGYTINKIQLPLFRTATTTGSYEISIYTNNSGVPGTLVPGAQLSDLASNLGTSSAIQSFNISWTLNPNTQYFLVVSGLGLTSSFVSWDLTDGTESAIGFPSAYTRTTNSGSTWLSPVEDPQMQMRITAVPEPSTYILSLVTVGMFAVVAKRKRNRNSNPQVAS